MKVRRPSGELLLTLYTAGHKQTSDIMLRGRFHGLLFDP